MVSILSERRSFQPYGLEGGMPGARGINLLTLASDGSNRTINLGGKNTVSVGRGDRLTIQSPGGGGFGDPGDEREASTRPQPRVAELMSAGSLNQYVMNQESV